MAQKKEVTDWVPAARKTHRDLFSELDALLKGVDRFFNIENLPSTKEDLTESNFLSELTAVRDVILRILSILELVIPEHKKNIYWFQKFAETKFFSDSNRDIFRKNLYKQDTPEKGLLLLYISFMNFKNLITDLLKTGVITYLSYLNIGEIISKEIRENNYFSPFRKDINPDFDMIKNQQISEIVNRIKDKDTKKHISIIFIYLFRLLRYLNHIDVTSQKTMQLHTSLIILVLIRSEIVIFRNYIEKTTDKIAQRNLKLLLQALSYQLSMETKRVYLQELKEILNKKAPRYFLGRIENSQGILKNLIEQSIIHITQSYKSILKGEDVFPSFTTRLEQSLKLREDVFVLHNFLKLLEDKAEMSDERVMIFESLRNFMLYFESLTFRLLRHDDYEEFVHFFNEVLQFKKEHVIEGLPHALLEKVHNFKIFIEVTLRNIGNRSELLDKPLDVERANKVMDQYIVGT